MVAQRLAMVARERADLMLVRLGFFESRARAQAAIAAGLVTADGAVVRRASEALAPDAAITAEAPHPWVSRGGVKLSHALELFGVAVEGRVALDVGASTGGFSDVLLRRGAARVYAVDAGHGQLHPSLAGEPRLVSLEGQDARALDAALIPRPVDLVTMDVSFISAALVLPAVLPLAAEGADLVVLVKPQFEVGRQALGRGGIVRDEAARQGALDRIARVVTDLGWALRGTTPSPIQGGDGNQEWLLAASRS